MQAQVVTAAAVNLHQNAISDKGHMDASSLLVKFACMSMCKCQTSGFCTTYVLSPQCFVMFVAVFFPAQALA